MVPAIGFQRVGLVGLVCLVALVAAGVIWRFGHRLWMRTWGLFFWVTRSIRARGTAISTIGTLAVVIAAYWLGDLSAIVIVTLFYATALFFTNFLQSERPFPVVAFENRYYGDGYGSDGEEGFQYEFGLQNNGTANLVDPAVEYRLYDAEFRPVTEDLPEGWIEHSDTDRANVTLAPGEHERIEIEHSPIEHDGETDYYLCIKITPRVQYSEVTLLFTREIAADE